MLYEQDMNEEAYCDGSGTDLWIGSDRIWHPELRMRSADVWDMTILLNSPESSPVPNQSTTHNSPFFSDFKESSASPQSTPIDSEDSDIGANQALQSLHISSLKGSHTSSPSLSTKQSRARAPTQSASPQSSHPLLHHANALVAVLSIRPLPLQIGCLRWQIP